MALCISWSVRAMGPGPLRLKVPPVLCLRARLRNWKWLHAIPLSRSKMGFFSVVLSCLSGCPFLPFGLCGVRCDIRSVCSSGTRCGIGGCMARISLTAAVLVALVGLPSGSAYAVADVGSVRFVHPSIDPNFGGTQPIYRSLTHSAAGWQFSGDGKIGWVGKPQAPVTASRTMNFAKVGKFLGTKARVLGPLGWVALAFSGIGWVWDAGLKSWLRPATSTAPIGGWGGWRAVYDFSMHGSAAAACNHEVLSQGWSGVTGGTVHSFLGNHPTPRYSCKLIPQGSEFSYVYREYACDEGFIWANGSCVSPETVPATDEDMDSALATIAEATPAATTWAWAPGDVVPAEADRPVVTGPASVVGPETVTTTQSPSGTTTRRQAKTADLTYAGDVVKADIRTVTTTTNPDGSVETEEEVIGSDEEPKPAETTDFCEDHPTASACLPRWCDEHPNSLECQDVTQSVTVPELELETREIDTDLESEWSVAGTCPSPGSLLIGGRQIQWSWQPICDFASGLRPVVIAVAFLSAALFVFGMVRE